MSNCELAFNYNPSDSSYEYRASRGGRFNMVSKLGFQRLLNKALLISCLFLCAAFEQSSLNFLPLSLALSTFIVIPMLCILCLPLHVRLGSQMQGTIGAYYKLVVIYMPLHSLPIGLVGCSTNQNLQLVLSTVTNLTYPTESFSKVS